MITELSQSNNIRNRVNEIVALEAFEDSLRKQLGELLAEGTLRVPNPTQDFPTFRAYEQAITLAEEVLKGLGETYAIFERYAATTEREWLRRLILKREVGAKAEYFIILDEMDNLNNPKTQ